MIVYDNGGAKFLWNIARIDGSVFPRALWVSLPCSIITMLLVVGINAEWTQQFQHFDNEDSVMNNNAVWGGFSVLAGFLVIFRTSQAYSRFWEGATSTHKMGAEWFDSCSSLVAFCKASTAAPEVVTEFENLLVRLFSMLHAAALGEIEDSTLEDVDTNAFKMDLIDPEAIDEASIMHIKQCDAKVELIFQWIQQLVVKNIKTGVLAIPPPILSRAFQEIASGMVHFHDAMKISSVPFPFPYAQTCDCLLLLHWGLVPFVVSQWVDHEWWAGIFSFMQVFALWVLNFIAMELENPFGTDANDIDGESMQRVMNNNLRLLLHPHTKQVPHLSRKAGQDEEVTMRMLRESNGQEACSFVEIWGRLPDEEVVEDGTTGRPSHRGTIVAKRFASRRYTSPSPRPEQASQCCSWCRRSRPRMDLDLRSNVGDTEESREAVRLTNSPAHSSMPDSRHSAGFQEPGQPAPAVRPGMQFDIPGSGCGLSTPPISRQHSGNAGGEQSRPDTAEASLEKSPAADCLHDPGPDEDDLDIEKVIANRLQEINDCIDHTPVQVLPPDPGAEKRAKLYESQEELENRNIEPLLYEEQSRTSSRARSRSPAPPPDRPAETTHCSAMQAPFLACHACASDGPESSATDANVPGGAGGSAAAEEGSRLELGSRHIGDLSSPTSPCRDVPEVEGPPPPPRNSDER